MTYETAKKLKDAGYSQEDPRRAPVSLTNENVHEFVMKAKGDCYIPNLSELIEACGDVFYDLQQKPIKEGWEATAFLSLATHAEGKGDTPEEAVANLWLRLNDKEALDKTPPNKV